MIKTRKLIPFFILGAVMLIITQAIAAKRTDWDRTAAQRRADYYYLRLATMMSIDSADESFLLVRRAHELAPDDKEIASQYALFRLANRSDIANGNDFETLYNIVRDYVDSSPEDYVTGSILAKLARDNNKFDDLVHIWDRLAKQFPQKDEPPHYLAEALLLRFITGHDSADWSRAMNIYRRIERGTGKSVELTSNKIRALMLLNDTTATVGELKSLTDSLPRNLEARLYAGQIYQTLGLDSMAIASYNDADSIDPMDGRAPSLMAEYYRSHNDSLNYDKAVFRALESENIGFEVKLPLLRNYVSDLYTDSLQWPRIQHMFSILDRVNPGEPAMHQLYAAFEYSRDNKEEARDQFQFALALDPADINTLTSLMQLNLQLGDTVEFIKTAELGMKRVTDNLYFPIALASIYQLSGQAEKGLETIDTIRIAKINNPKAVANLMVAKGDLYHAMNNIDSCIAMYERAIRLDDSNHMVYNNLAYYMADADRDLDKAERYARIANLGDADNPTYLDTYAWVYFKKHDYEKAREYIDRAIERSIDEYYEEIDTVVAATDTAANDSVKAVAANDSVANGLSLPENISNDILSHAGDIYFMCGQPDKALDFWREALIRKPDDELLQRKVANKTFFYE